MSAYAYDIEVFPNFFSIAFANLYTEETFVVYKINDRYSETYSEYDVFMMGVKALVGYNNLEFDDNLIGMFNAGSSNEELYHYAQLLIKDDMKRYARLPFMTLDLFKILHHDRMGISLKQCAINMKWPKIQDLPLAYNAIIQESQVDEILSYNFNDVYITKYLYHEVIDEIKLRADVGDTYNVNVMNKSRAGMGDKIMEKLFAEYTGLDPMQFKHRNTKRDIVKFSDCISPQINFQTEQLKQLLQDLKTIEVECQNLNEE